VAARPARRVFAQALASFNVDEGEQYVISGAEVNSAAVCQNILREGSLVSNRMMIDLFQLH
jgi:hypothetical protein